MFVTSPVVATKNRFVATAVAPDYLTSQIENANLPMVQSTLIIGGMEKDDD